MSSTTEHVQVAIDCCCPRKRSDVADWPQLRRNLGNLLTLVLSTLNGTEFVDFLNMCHVAPVIVSSIFTIVAANGWDNCF